MEILWEYKGQIVHMRLAGRVDLEAYPELKKAIEYVQERPEHRVLVNLRDVILISSSGVGALVNLARDLEKMGGKMALVELSPVCKKVIEFLRLDDVLRIFENVTEATAYLES